MAAMSTSHSSTRTCCISSSSCAKATSRPLGQVANWHNLVVTILASRWIPSYEIVLIGETDPLWKRACKVILGPVMMILCGLWSLWCKVTCRGEGYHRLFTIMMNDTEEKALSVIRKAWSYERNPKMWSSSLVHDAILFGKSPKFIQALLKLDPPAPGADGSNDLIPSACRCNKPETLRMLLNTTVPRGNNCLYEAISCARRETPELIETVKILLAVNMPVHRSIGASSGPLSVACRKGYLQVVNMLLDAGASVHEKDEEGDTALHKAASVGDLVIVRRLMQVGASLAVQNDEEQTPFHMASGAGHICMGDSPRDGGPWLRQVDSFEVYSILEDFIQAGVDVNAKDKYGNTALSMAARCWCMAETAQDKRVYERVADILIQAGAVRDDWEKAIRENAEV